MNEHKNLGVSAGAPTRRQVIGGAFALAALAVGSDRAWTQQSMPEARRQTASQGGSSKGSMSVACYKPRPGFEQALLELVRNHPAFAHPGSRHRTRTDRDAHRRRNNRGNLRVGFSGGNRRCSQKPRRSRFVETIRVGVLERDAVGHR
jgi:hypothetical protein